MRRRASVAVAKTRNRVGKDFFDGVERACKRVHHRRGLGIARHHDISAKEFKRPLVFGSEYDQMYDEVAKRFIQKSTTFCIQVYPKAKRPVAIHQAAKITNDSSLVFSLSLRSRRQSTTVQPPVAGERELSKRHCARPCIAHMSIFPFHRRTTLLLQHSLIHACKKTRKQNAIPMKDSIIQTEAQGTGCHDQGAQAPRHFRLVRFVFVPSLYSIFVKDLLVHICSCRSGAASHSFVKRSKASKQRVKMSSLRNAYKCWRSSVVRTVPYVYQYPSRDESSRCPSQ